MSSTITTAKRVGAILTNTGRIGYALFEQTYESNVSPVEPRWCCICVGYIETVLTRIFGLASHCEGGMLRSRHGRISPESYIKSWLSELQAPKRMHDRETHLEFSDRWSSPLPLQKKDEVLAAFDKVGLGSLKDVVIERGITVSLERDFALLDALYGGIGIGAWKYMGHSLSEYLGNAEELGYKPERKAAPKGEPEVFVRVGQEALLQRQKDRTFKSVGWDYEVIGAFIEGYARLEIQYPGSYARAIRAFRAACQRANPVPADATARIRLSEIHACYGRTLAQRLATRLGLDAQDMRVCLADVRALGEGASDAQYCLLNTREARWTISHASEESPITDFAQSLFA